MMLRLRSRLPGFCAIGVERQRRCCSSFFEAFGSGGSGSVFCFLLTKDLGLGHRSFTAQQRGEAEGAGFGVLTLYCVISVRRPRCRGGEDRHAESVKPQDPARPRPAFKSHCGVKRSGLIHPGTAARHSPTLTGQAPKPQLAVSDGDPARYVAHQPRCGAV